VQYLPHNVHCNTLHSTHNTTVHLLCSTFHILFNVTHYFQPTIPLSTCCEVPSNVITLNPQPCHFQHSTLTLSTTNLTAAHNSYRSNTQQALPKTNLKASILARAWLYLKFYACSILFSYLQCTVWSKKFCIKSIYNTLKMLLHSVFGFS